MCCEAKDGQKEGCSLVGDWLKIGCEAKDGQKEWLFSGWSLVEDWL